MNGNLFRTWLARPVSAGLVVVLFALSVAAGFHQGDHDDLGWLPEKFHRHHFRWAADAEEAHAPLIDHCMACHVGRMIVRLTPSPPALPDAPALVFAGASRPAAGTPARTDFLSAPRAPPAS